MCLLINSKEQMFTEKLRSLLKFGRFSTRYKDIFDLCFLSERVDREALLACLQTMIFDDPGIRENDLAAVLRRVESTLNNRSYLRKLAGSDKNWLELDTKEAAEKLTEYLRSLL